MLFLKFTAAVDGGIQNTAVQHQIQLPVSQHTGKIGSGFFNQADLDQRISAGKIRNQRRQDPGGKQVASSEGECSFSQIAPVVYKSFKFILDTFYFFYRFDILYPTFSKGKWFGTPVKDRISDVVLDTLYVGTE